MPPQQALLPSAVCEQQSPSVRHPLAPAGSLQRPSQQTWPAGQSASPWHRLRSQHTPSQQAWPAGQHTSPQQTWSAAQQAQVLLLFGSSVVQQTVCPGGQVMQVPPSVGQQTSVVPKVVQVLPTPQQVASCAPGWQSDEPAGQVETH